MKAQCLQCHAVSGFGATLGPDLAETVKKHQGKKLLQQILEPSSEIHPKYQTMQFVLDSGEIVTGVVVKEDDERVSRRQEFAHASRGDEDRQIVDRRTRGLQTLGDAERLAECADQVGSSRHAQVS